MKDHEQDRALRELVERVPVDHLPPRVRERALDAALAAGPAAPPARRWWLLAPAGLALAGAALAIVLVRRDAGSRSSWGVLAAGETRAVGHAQVAVAPAAIALHRGDAEVVLDAGRVDVDVDPAPHRPFRVVTAAFSVDVLGTAFSVEPSGVVVERGVVRITSPTGAVLVPRLVAGERWSLPGLAVVDHASTAASTAVPGADTAAVPGADTAAVPGADTAAVPGADTAAVPGSDTAAVPGAAAAADSVPAADPAHASTLHARSAQAWIAEARALVAAGDVVAARADVQKALATHPPRALRSDAEALIAESYLRAGDLDIAVTHFLEVADRYRDLVTGEAALFAAARYQQKLGHREAARRLLATYLERYPDGSLAPQARAQLGAP